MLDTNVLLDAYRFAAQARRELLDSLRKVGERLWIPHQVALEFHRNRVPVIVEHDAAYRDTIALLTEFRSKLHADFGGKLAELASRVALPEDQGSRLENLVLYGLDEAARELQKMRQLHGVPQDSLRRDEILLSLQQLLARKVGEPLTAKEEEEARNEAAKRISNKKPPGYLDRKKDDPHGDYLFWVQALGEAKKRKIPLLIVTRDVKDDWFWKQSGRTIGARPELVYECRQEAGVPLTLMSTQTFLFHASKHLSIAVSEETIRQADSLPSPSEEEGKRLTPLSGMSLAQKGRYLIDHLDQKRSEVISARFG
ncbi:DUF4935 domain-containing protein [Micromonospora fiedleri]|uniref:DUF4935 domain-containing protein n=1 Tax=Micromonospora fiedleri TaxID=1157498 RepID=A0ABS1US46_9ACTN|nr:PIN domain-containing protein [Micromonospora fiedleri]MBL6279184.1 DUF4935 domain-containing protein [Micromonospora fiedleri]